MRVTNFIIGFILLTLTTLVTNSFASIGEVTIHNGSAVIDRQDGDKNIEVEKQLDVFSYDTVKTGQGQVGIKFVDDIVYDPNTNTGKLSLKATLGTVRYASGQIAKNSAQNVNIKTPTATIAVRGTDFAMTVNEIGGSTIVLLPSCNGNGQCYVGEIEVQTDAGFVIMNQAFQATQVDTMESKPMKPVLLSLDEDMINNLLIVAQPKEIENQVEEEKKLRQIANALDIDFLKFDDLEVDLLEAEEDDAVSQLDIDFLDQDFLVDILEQLNKQLALQIRSEFDKGKDKKKTGQDEFGVILLDEDPQWVWKRTDESGNNIELRLDQEYGYIINVTQGDIEIIDYELGDSPTNQIRINQQ